MRYDILLRDVYTKYISYIRRLIALSVNLLVNFESIFQKC